MASSTVSSVDMDVEEGDLFTYSPRGVVDLTNSDPSTPEVLRYPVQETWQVEELSPSFPTFTSDESLALILQEQENNEASDFALAQHLQEQEESTYAAQQMDDHRYAPPSRSLPPPSYDSVWRGREREESDPVEVVDVDGVSSQEDRLRQEREDEEYARNLQRALSRSRSTSDVEGDPPLPHQHTAQCRTAHYHQSRDHAGRHNSRSTRPSWSVEDRPGRGGASGGASDWFPMDQPQTTVRRTRNSQRRATDTDYTAPSSHSHHFHTAYDHRSLGELMYRLHPGMVALDQLIGEETNDYEELWNLSERIGNVKGKGLSKQDLSTLPTSRYIPKVGAAPSSGVSKVGGASSSNSAPSSSEDTSCLICMSEFEANEMLRILPCLHRFHMACIDKWLKTSADCPICRHKVRDQLHQSTSNDH